MTMLTRGGIGNSPVFKKPVKNSYSEATFPTNSLFGFVFILTFIMPHGTLLRSERSPAAKEATPSSPAGTHHAADKHEHRVIAPSGILQLSQPRRQRTDLR